MKCFKFLLLNVSDPLQTITDFPPTDWCHPKKNIDGMTIAAETGNLQIMQMIEEKGGTLSQPIFARFLQN